MTTEAQVTCLTSGIRDAQREERQRKWRVKKKLAEGSRQSAEEAMGGRMRSALMLSLLVACSGCSNPATAGCTLENCRAMIDSCRTGFDDISTRCFTTNRLPDRELVYEYCRQGCSILRGGPIAQCIADRAGECRDGGTAVASAVGGSCSAMFQRPAPQAACEAACRADRTKCDDKCTGGPDCDSCFRSGLSCPDLCPDAGFVACADCSIRCRQTYQTCTDGCPTK